jgi:pimeloyl-ACP methyl ester carboxylesterase
MLWRYARSGLWLYALVLVGSMPAPSWAQAERYELGRRLRQFELAFEQERDPAVRARAYPPMNQAVLSFFALKLGEAGRSMDQARYALQAEPPGPTQRWADSLYLVLEPRLLDAEKSQSAFQLKAFYPTDESLPSGAMLRFELIFPDGSRRPLGEPWSIKEVPLKGTLEFTKVPEGDVQLRYTVATEETRTGQVSGTIGLSFVKNLEPRLTALVTAVDGLPSAAASVEQASLRTNVQLLKTLGKAQSPETDYPAVQLLKEAEEVLAAERRREPFYGRGKSGQFWLTLLTGRTRTVVRLMAPEAVKAGKPLPVVLALHGAGGSENMFFDTYGHGKIVELCRRRGWLLVAPRNGGFGAAPLSEVLEEVAKLYPIDNQRVYVVGHSMGAAQALMNARQTPERFQAVAALGGGRAVGVTEPMKKLAFFVGIGTKDFAYRGAKALGDALAQAQVRQFSYREYPEVEHLIIVQIALEDVFAFFEAASRQGDGGS